MKLWQDLTIDKEILEIYNYRPVSDEDFARNCMVNPLWRMNNIYKIINKKGYLIDFKMNKAQMLVESVKHKRKIILKTRQRGISTYYLIKGNDYVLFNPYKTSGLIAHELKAAGELSEKCRIATENIDPIILEDWGITKTKDNEGRIEYSNKSKIMIGTSFRSGTLHNLHISELGKIAAKDPKKALEIKTGTLQAAGENCNVSIESTGEGPWGLFYDMWDRFDNIELKHLAPTDYYPIFLGWTDDPDCRDGFEIPIPADLEEYFKKTEDSLHLKLLNEQKYWYTRKKINEVGSHMTQEYPATPEEAFISGENGAYYQDQLATITKTKDLWDSRFVVFVDMDVGRDMFFCLFYQKIDGKPKIIDNYSIPGKGIDHFANILKKKVREGYDIYEINGPHDLKQHTVGETKDRVQTFRDHGITIRVTKKLPLEDGIDLVRGILPYCEFDTRCNGTGTILESLSKYSKVWEERSETWGDKPKKSKYNHGSDAFRYLATNFKDKPNDKISRTYLGHRYSGPISDLEDYTTKDTVSYDRFKHGDRSSFYDASRYGRYKI